MPTVGIAGGVRWLCHAGHAQQQADEMGYREARSFHALDVRE